jgi:alkylated DNA repair dioxygenase AlkB
VRSSNFEDDAGITSSRKRTSDLASLPPGLIYAPEFLSLAEESELVAFIQTLDFRTFQMQGVTARRRIRQFGWHYAFESYRLTPADPIPSEFAHIRQRAAALIHIDPSDWAEALVTEYAPGAGIGWHRDAPPFGLIAGISLAGSCRMRFQTGTGSSRQTCALVLAPRSIYLLTGEARTSWQHMIPPARELRYSITFRTLRTKKKNSAPAG